MIGFAALVLASAAAGAAAPARAAEARPAPVPAAEKQELEALRTRLDRLKKDLAAAEGDRAEAADQLKDVERSVSDANRALRELTEASATARRELRELESATRRTEADIAGRADDLSRLLYGRYVAGEHTAARVLLSGGDPHRIARELHYLGHVSRAQSATIRGLRADVAERRTLAERIRDKAAELARLEGEQRTARARLEAERREQRNVVARLAGQIQTQRREIQSAERNEQRLAKLVESLTRMLRERAERAERERRAEAERTARQRAEAARKSPRAPAEGTPSETASNRPPARGPQNDKVPEAGEFGGVFSSLRGRLRLPVRGEVSGRFGAARTDGGPSWKGVFIRSNPGQEVRAVGPGRVVFADWMRGFGNLLIVDHGEGYLTIYGNNESLLKQPGDAVKPGDTIATVGASGGSEFSGLYFELRHQGRPIDPSAWLAR